MAVCGTICRRFVFAGTALGVGLATSARLLPERVVSRVTPCGFTWAQTLGSMRCASWPRRCCARAPVPPPVPPSCSKKLNWGRKGNSSGDARRSITSTEGIVYTVKRVSELGKKGPKWEAKIQLGRYAAVKWGQNRRLKFASAAARPKCPTQLRVLRAGARCGARPSWQTPCPPSQVFVRCAGFYG